MTDRLALAFFAVALLICVWYATTHTSPDPGTVPYACVVYETGEPCP